MQHRLPIADLGPRGNVMADAVLACVHCGFCLPTCPTYSTLGEEMDSPRGRIVLMKSMLEGELDLEEGLPFVDRCLGCVACETACPSGVEYGALLTSFRAHAEPRRRRPPGGRWLRRRMLGTLARPRRMRWLARLAPWGRILAPLVPSLLREAHALLPRRLPKEEPLPAVTPAVGERRARVALLPSCAQQVLVPGVDGAALRVLSRNGVEVVIPAGAGCCGALALHAGEDELARRLSRRNLFAFPEAVDAVLTTAAGCGSGLRDAPLLWAGRPEEGAARKLAGRVEDVSTFLHRLGIEPPPPLPVPRSAVYHDACHLAHAQGEREAPRALLRAIPGLELKEPAEWELCCGSAGVYNLEQPEVAGQLGERKARHLLATGAQLVVTGNVGCLLQIEKHLQHLEAPPPILHTLEVLDRAYGWPQEG